MATSATELGNEPAVEMPKTDSEAKLPRDFPDLADDAEEEIVVGWLTKRVVRAPCCFLWAILAFVIFITLAVVAVEVAPARGFLDVFAVPWFNPKYEVVVLRGLGVDLLYEDKLVSTEDTTDENKDQSANSRFIQSPSHTRTSPRTTSSPPRTSPKLSKWRKVFFRTIGRIDVCWRIWMRTKSPRTPTAGRPPLCSTTYT
mmetsp:Transcript_19220/g.48938  ORF Transcript_19220/g.48938 Transcript_19220/m.48938 type:complete len:200 (+) Transcript_19220:156-755(+)